MNKEALVVAGKETDKTKYMVTFRDQKAGRSHNAKIDNNSFERAEQFKYLGTTLTYPNALLKNLRPD